MSATELRDALETYAGANVRRAGFVAQASYQRNAPVSTGALRNSFNCGPLHWSDNALLVTLGTNIAYAQYADRVSTSVPPGYIDRAAELALPDVINELQAGLDATAPHLWKDSL